VKLLLVIEIMTIMKFSKFKNDFNNFGLVIARETAVGATIKNAFAALEY
jgi:hypothetical protein